MNHDYDVALSFAGEDRAYVREVADMLHEIGIKVFYDEYKEVELWGKDLYEELDDIYQNKSKYCVIFVSKCYKEKVWPNHERKSAQARDLIENNEYIRPVKLDETEIPGIRPTIKSIDGNRISSENLAYLIAKKVNPDFDTEDMIRYLREELPDYDVFIKGKNVVFRCDIEDYYGEFSLRLLLEMYKIGEIDRMFLMPEIVPI